MYREDLASLSLFSFCYYINYFVDGISRENTDIIIRRSEIDNRHNVTVSCRRNYCLWICLLRFIDKIFLEIRLIHDVFNDNFNLTFNLTDDNQR